MGSLIRPPRRRTTCSSCTSWCGASATGPVQPVIERTEQRLGGRLAVPQGREADSDANNLENLVGPTGHVAPPHFSSTLPTFQMRRATTQSSGPRASLWWNGGQRPSTQAWRRGDVDPLQMPRLGPWIPAIALTTTLFFAESVPIGRSRLSRRHPYGRRDRPSTVPGERKRGRPRMRHGAAQVDRTGRRGVTAALQR